MRGNRGWGWTIVIAVCVAQGAYSQAARPFQPPEGIGYRRADIRSEGTRMQAEVFWSKELEGQKLPTLILSHGWGGTAALLRPEAVWFARHGYLVVTFDYRGWGESDSRVILANPAPDPRQQRFTAEVIAVREVVDPLDQINDLLNALHWVQGEPMCDRERIGLWGSSYSGGHVVAAAARDRRVKAVVSQVPALDSRFVLATPEERDKTYDEATRRARGELGYPEPGARVVGNLRGGPIREKMIHYVPAEESGKAAGCALLFITAENEELFDNADHAGKAFANAAEPKKMVTIPKITHYGVYLAARKQAQELALGWFDEHLKSAGQ